MRRVYYTYLLRLVSTRGVFRGFFMLGLLIALSYFVSLGNVIANVMQVQVGHLGNYFVDAISKTEVWTLLILGIFIYSLFSFRFKRGEAEEVHSFVKA